MTANQQPEAAVDGAAEQWHADVDSRYTERYRQAYVVDDAGNTVATVPFDFRPDGKTNRAIPRAHQIAAAPTMLAALEAAAGFLATETLWLDSDDQVDALEALESQVKAAIAAARGVTP